MNLALFLHVLGAMLLVGTLLVVSAALLLGWLRAEPDEAAELTRHGLRAVAWGVLPSYVVMRVGAQWVEAEADIPFDPAWIGIGYVVADAGAVFLLVSLILAAIALRRLRRGGGTGLARAVGVISVILLAAYLVAVWAMSAKPD